MGYSSGGGGASYPELGEPTGFLDRFDSTLTFNPATRTLTLAPLSGSFAVFFAGAKRTYSSPLTATIPSGVSGYYYFYLDNLTGGLLYQDFFSEDLLLTHAFVSVVVWNNTQGKHVYFADERHGAVMDGATHIHFHTAFGAQYVSGLGLLNIIADGSGSDNLHARFGVADGVIRDEDIKITATDNAPQELAPYGALPVLYRLGATAEWYRGPVVDYPVLNPTNATYTNVGRLGYNFNNAGTWQVAQVANSQFVLSHVVATNDIEHPIQVIAGKNYATISAAEDGAVTEFAGLTGLPFTEFVLLATVIFQSANSYTNAIKARIRSNNGFDYIDWRKANPFNVSAGGAAAAPVAPNSRTFAFFAS